MGASFDKFLSEGATGQPAPAGTANPSAQVAPVLENKATSSFDKFLSESPVPEVVSQPPALINPAVVGLVARKGADLTPENAAQILDINKRTGLPLAVIERNLKGIQGKESQAKAFTFVQDNPVTGRWLTSSPVNFSLGRDDWPTLQKIEKLGQAGMQGLTFLPKALGALGRAVDDISAAINPNIPTGHGENDLYAIADRAEKYWSPDVDKGTAMAYATDIVRTLSQMGSTAVIGGAGGMLPLMASGSGLQKYEEARQGGASIGRSAVAGGLQFGLEYTTELKPIEVLTKPGMEFARRLVEGVVYDIGGELVARIGEMKLIDEKVLGKSYTTEQYVQAIKDTIIVAGGVTGAATVGAHVMDRVAQDPKPIIDNLGDLASNSQLIKRSPVAFEDLVAHATTGTDFAETHIPVETWDTYWQEKGLDPREMAQEITGGTEAYDTAAMESGDIVMTTAQYARRIAPTEHNAFFADKAKLKAVPTPMDTAATQVSRAVTKGLINTGMNKAEARVQGEALYGTAFKNLGERTGINPVDLFNKYNLKIKGAATIGENVKPIQADWRGALTLSKSERSSLSYARSSIDEGEAGYRLFIDQTEMSYESSKDQPRVIGVSSTFPAYFTNKGYTKKESLRLIDKALAGEVLAEKQLAVVNDLNQGVRRELADRAMQYRAERPTMSQESKDAHLANLEREQAMAEAVGARDIADAMAAEKALMGESFDQPAYHGSPHKFDKFMLEHIGKGEGAQAYGWGLYFAENKDVAEWYRDKLAGEKTTLVIDGIPYDNTQQMFSKADNKDRLIYDAYSNAGAGYRNKKNVLQELKNRAKGAFKGWKPVFKEAIEKLKSDAVVIEAEKGTLYKVELPDISEYFDWDKPLNEQSEKVKKALQPLLDKYRETDGVEGIHMAEGYTGQQIYREIEYSLINQGKAAPGKSASREASLYLKSIGIPGIKYLEGASRDKGEGHHNFVIFDEELIKIEEYWQNKGKDARGRITFTPQGVNIELLKNANRSTFIHETGHFYLKVMGDLAGMDGAKSGIKADYKVITDWLGAKEGERITDAQHEQWARGFEAYLMEGKAPSVALRSAFSRFKVWLTEVYHKLTALNVELTPEVRDVMDRIFASDTDILAAKAEAEAAAIDYVAEGKNLEDITFADLVNVIHNEGTKSIIRRMTGLKDTQKMIGEDVALSAAWKKAEQASRVAFKEGQKAGVETQRKKAAAIASMEDMQLGRNQQIDALVQEFNLSGQDIKEALNLNKMLGMAESKVGLMTDEEFKSFEEHILQVGMAKSSETELNAQAKADNAKAYMAEILARAQERKALRDSIAKLKKTVDRLSESPSVSGDYRAKIKAVMDGYELSGHTQATISQLEATQAYLDKAVAAGEDVTIPQRVLDKLQILGRIPKEELTLSQVQGLQNEIDLLAKLGKTKWASKEALYDAEKQERKNALLESASPILSSQLPSAPIGSGPRVWAERYIWLRNYLQKSRLALKPIDGLADITGMHKMKSTLDLNYGAYLTYNDSAFRAWHELTKDFVQGNFERIGAVAIARQDGGIERLANSGRTEADINAIKLTPQEKAAYQFVRDTFEGEFPAVQKYALDVYNEDVGQVKNYVSFMSDNNAMSDLEIYERFGQRPEEIVNLRTKTVEQGFRKKRATVSKIKPELNIDKIFRRHMDDVAWMLTMGKDIKQYSEIVNSPEMKTKLGDIGALAWLQWLDLMARKGGADSAKRIAALDYMRRNVGAGVLAFRLSSTLVQLTSFADTMGTIGAEWATKGAASIATSKEWRNFVMDNFAEVNKAVGDDVAFREFGEGMFAKVTRVGMTPLQFFDGLMRATAAAGAYQKLAAERGVEIDLTKPNKALIEEATKLMRESQGSSFFKDQPLGITTGFGLAENRSVNKTILQFQSFMLSRWDNIQRQVWRLGIKEKDYGKAAMSFFWMVIVAAAMEEGLRRTAKAAINLVTGDKSGTQDSFAKGTLLNTIQNVPLLGQIISSMTYASNPVPVVKAIDEAIKGGSAVAKAKTPKAKARGAVKAIGAVGTLAGVPGSSQGSQVIEKALSDKNRR